MRNRCFVENLQNFIISVAWRWWQRSQLRQVKSNKVNHVMIAFVLTAQRWWPTYWLNYTSINLTASLAATGLIIQVLDLDSVFRQSRKRLLVPDYWSYTSLSFASHPQVRDTFPMHISNNMQGKLSSFARKKKSAMYHASNYSTLLAWTS